jgi:hypothetical protein
MTTSVIKRAVRAVLPASLEIPLTAIRARRHSQRLNRRWGLDALGDRLFDAIGPVVRSGPFRGLVLPREAVAEHVGPYLLGTYERELHDFWPTLPRGAVPLVVNVGSKLGYYAAGLSRLLDAPAVAFDADPWARRMTRRTAQLNGTAVEVRGTCRRTDLDSLPAGSLVVIDCDGGEEALLRDPVPAGLTLSSVVLELHGPMLEHDEIADRLRATHEVRVVPSMDAPPPSDLDFLDAEERRLAVLEIRTPQRWLLCTPLEATSSRAGAG